jgi:hypothetical protein
MHFAKTSDKIQPYLFRKKTPQYCIEGYIRTSEHRHTLKLIATIPTANCSETYLAHPTFKLFSFLRQNWKRIKEDTHTLHGRSQYAVLILRWARRRTVDTQMGSDQHEPPFPSVRTLVSAIFWPPLLALTGWYRASYRLKISFTRPSWSRPRWYFPPKHQIPRQSNS